MAIGQRKEACPKTFIVTNHVQRALGDESRNEKATNGVSQQLQKGGLMKKCFLPRTAQRKEGSSGGGIRNNGDQWGQPAAPKGWSSLSYVFVFALGQEKRRGGKNEHRKRGKRPQTPTSSRKTNGVEIRPSGPN